MLVAGTNVCQYAGMLITWFVGVLVDPYGITNKRKRKEVSAESFYNDRIPLSVWHEVKGQ